MRLFNMTLVVLAAVLLASGTAVSKADQTSVSNVDVVHSSRVLAGEDKRFLRRHQTTDDEGELAEYDDEERNELLGALVLQNMQHNALYRFEMFHKWKANDFTSKYLAQHVPDTLVNLYKAFREMYG